MFLETSWAWTRLLRAYGVAEVVDENMANAARVHAVENGEDLSEYTMIALWRRGAVARRPTLRKAWCR